eukprot:740619-Amphidinium_carterae.1
MTNIILTKLIQVARKDAFIGDSATVINAIAAWAPRRLCWRLCASSCDVVRSMPEHPSLRECSTGTSQSSGTSWRSKSGFSWFSSWAGVLLLRLRDNERVLRRTCFQPASCSWSVGFSGLADAGMEAPRCLSVYVSP